jgi:hypothetical protein
VAFDVDHGVQVAADGKHDEVGLQVQAIAFEWADQIEAWHEAWVPYVAELCE